MWYWHKQELGPNMQTVKMRVCKILEWFIGVGILASLKKRYLSQLKNNLHVFRVTFSDYLQV